MAKIYKCDMCDAEIKYTDSPTGNQWLYEVIISPIQCPNNHPQYEICHNCYDRLANFIGSMYEQSSNK